MSSAAARGAARAARAHGAARPAVRRRQQRGVIAARPPAPAASAEQAEQAPGGSKWAVAEFALQRQAKFGECFAVVGSCEALGEWDVGRAPRLMWSDGDVWEADVIIPAGETIEYKYVKIDDASGKIHDWQPGDNLELCPGVGLPRLQVCDVWEGAGRVVSTGAEVEAGAAEAEAGAAEASSSSQAEDAGAAATPADEFALEDGETEEVLFEAGANGVSELGMSLEEAVAATGDVEPADADPADSSCSESESDGEPIQFDNMDGDTVIDATEVRARLKQLKVVELKSELRAHGLPVSGRKADLVERLVSALFEDEEH